jgi:hypothetical protein
MQHGQKFNNTLQDNSQLTDWTKCDATWSEIQQHLARQQSTVTKCDATWSEIQQHQDNSQLQNVMQHGQKFNNTKTTVKM